MKLVVLFVFVAFSTSSAMLKFSNIIEDEFETFKLTYGRQYSTPFDEAFRYKVFLDNLQKIREHNLNYEAGKVTFTMGINKFTDMLTHEVSAMLYGFDGNRLANSTAATFIVPAGLVIPDEVDWSNRGAVTSVKDQEQCRSCWAFSSTGALEGQHFRKTGKLVSLSEQNLIDCSSHIYGNHGCNGGSTARAFQYIIANNGIDTEQAYPYVARDRFQCAYTVARRGATVINYAQIPPMREDALKAAVAGTGPISVSVYANHTKFHQYESGVYLDPDCNGMPTNHAMLVVGYGTEEGTGLDYWLVKNSWGKNWGLNGYIKMARNQNNNCCIACYAIYPLV